MQNQSQRISFACMDSSINRGITENFVSTHMQVSIHILGALGYKIKTNITSLNMEMAKIFFCRAMHQIQPLHMSALTFPLTIICSFKLYIFYETTTKVLQSSIDTLYLQDLRQKIARIRWGVFLMVSTKDFTQVELLRLMEFSPEVSV